MAQAQTKVAAKPVPWWLVLIQGIATLIIGLYLVTAPGATTMILVRFLGWYWFFVGIFSFVEIFIGESKTHWAIHVLKGLLGILAGLLVLDHPLLSTVLVPSTLIIILGIEGLFIGILGVFSAFQGEGWGAAILGLLSIVLGILLLTNTLIAAAALPITLGVLAIMFGIATIVYSFAMDKS